MIWVDISPLNHGEHRLEKQTTIYIFSSIQLCFRKTQSIKWKGTIHVGIIKEGVIWFGLISFSSSFVIINLPSFRLRHQFWLDWPHPLAALLLSFCACLWCTQRNLSVENMSCSKWMCMRQCCATQNLGSSQSPGSSLVPLQLVWTGTSQLLLGLQLFVQN